VFRVFVCFVKFLCRRPCSTVIVVFGLRFSLTSVSVVVCCCVVFLCSVVVPGWVWVCCLWCVLFCVCSPRGRSVVRLCRGCRLWFFLSCWVLWFVCSLLVPSLPLCYVVGFRSFRGLVPFRAVFGCLFLVLFYLFRVSLFVSVCYCLLFCHASVSLCGYCLFGLFLFACSVFGCVCIVVGLCWRSVSCVIVLSQTVKMFFVLWYVASFKEMCSVCS